MRTQFEHSPPSWWLGGIAALDAVSPGVCGALLRASPHRQQVVATVLALHHSELMTSHEQISRLVVGRLDELLADVIGSNPCGLLGCLRRMSAKIEPPAFYCKLGAVYSDPMHKDLVRAFRHVVGLNSTMLDVAVGSPNFLLNAGAFRALASPRQRDDLVAAVELIREVCPTATDDALDTSLRSAVDHHAIPGFILTWLSKSNFPDAPVPRLNDIVHIATGSDLHRVATDFENCLATFRLDILCGREAFYECRTPFGPMVARIGRDDSDRPWEFLGTHARLNRVPPRDACAWVESMFAEIGIRLPARRPERPERWQVFERLLDPWYEEWEDSVIDEVVAA